MSKSTPIKYTSRYTDIEYTAYRIGNDDIKYLGTSFKTIKQWINCVHRQEEVIFCSFIKKVLPDEETLVRLSDEILTQSRSLGINGEIDELTAKHFEDYHKLPEPMSYCSE